MQFGLAADIERLHLALGFVECPLYLLEPGERVGDPLVIEFWSSASVGSLRSYGVR